MYLEVCSGKNCSGYRGEQNKTISGKKCRPWNLRQNQYKPENNPGHGLESNFCRNPDNDDGGIWCFTSDSEFGFCKPLLE